MSNQVDESNISNEEDNQGLIKKISKNTNTVIRVYKTGGMHLLKQLLYIKVFGQKTYIRNYNKWIEKTEKRILKTSKLSFEPLISVVVPVYNVPDQMLIDCIESVKQQTYSNWQLCIADDASTWPSVHNILAQYENDEKIKIVYRKENGHISKSTNSAIEITDGEFLAFMDCDDTLSPNALHEVAQVINKHPQADFIYSDEDKINEDGTKRHYPHFKPDWAPDTLMSMMYTSHLGVYRKSLVNEVGCLREGFEGAQDYDLTLRITEKTKEIYHIPKVLYHWRERKESTSADAMAKPYVLDAQKRAKEEALQRRGLHGSVEFVEDAVQFRVKYSPCGNPLISIIIPSKDNFEVYARCVNSIFNKSNYKNIEIITVDNGSDEINRKCYEDFCDEHGVQYYYKPETFNFSHMCNQGADLAKGELLLFLNDDTEVINPEWLDIMAGQALLPHVGAVGAKLYYPDGFKLQHCGVVNRKEGPSHILCGFDDRLIADFGRNRLDFNYIAVTGACMMVSRNKFDEVGGYNEELPIAYNDIDLCFKLIEKGYYIVQRNDATLYHYESLSRGNDKVDKKKFKRLMNDRKMLYERHSKYYQSDMFFSYWNIGILNWF